jgi:hypothetical protein
MSLKVLWAIFDLLTPSQCSAAAPIVVVYFVARPIKACWDLTFASVENCCRQVARHDGYGTETKSKTATSWWLFYPFKSMT